MNNNKKINNISAIVTALIVICGLFATWFTYKAVVSVDTKKVSKKNAVEVNKSVYDQVTGPEKFGSKISPNEEGYGRANPFAPYK